mmetsp:Transcript_16521/g.34763  ORF Transcript_16521/g.34763 Transcript_16521/m.34763 type:complete len:120 (+) Transcript_16521:1007-1366(+)
MLHWLRHLGGKAHLLQENKIAGTGNVISLKSPMSNRVSLVDSALGLGMTCGHVPKEVYASTAACRGTYLETATSEEVSLLAWFAPSVIEAGTIDLTVEKAPGMHLGRMLYVCKLENGGT